MELSAEKFAWYNQRPIPPEIEWRGADLFNLPFKDGVLDFLYASHLIEDFSREEVWPKLFAEWRRVLKSGGYMVLLVPEVNRWAAALRKGQPPNCQHWAPEPSEGDMTRVAVAAGFAVVSERLTNLSPEDYSILGVFQKP